MIVLAYLLSAPLNALSKVGSGQAKTRILFGSRTTDEGDEEHLQRFAEILLGLQKESTSNALHESLPFKWNDDEKYDTVNPFGDTRQLQYHALWTFDTHNDLLRHTNRDGRSQVSLALLRERAVTLADMQKLGGPFPSPSEPILNSGLPDWKPQVEVNDRMRTFAYHLLRDFHCQWRHVLRNHYNMVTLRVLAQAIIRLSTLDFEVRQNTGGHGPRGVHVWITQLPAWEPFKSNLVRVGNVHIVLCQNLQEGLSVAQQHISSRGPSMTSPDARNSSKEQAHYMILSVKHIILCRATAPDTLQHTAPEILFNGDYGIGSPSDLALDYLIWATASARPSIRTALQSLPIEIQDTILGYVSVRTVEAAKTGCLLCLGSPFSWKDGTLEVTLEERYTIRPSGSSVESQVWFDDHKSGIVYLARARQR